MRIWERGRADGAEGPVEATLARDPMGLGMAMAVSVAVCTALFVLGVGLSMWVVTGEPVDSLGMGLFAALWGGPGFGVMAGGAVYTLSQERAAHAGLVERRAPVADRLDPAGGAAREAAGALVAS